MYGSDKFWSYLMGTKVVAYTDYVVIRYFLNKKDAKPWLIRWIPLLKKFYLEVKD